MSDHCRNCDAYLSSDPVTATAMDDLDGFVEITYKAGPSIEVEQFCSPACLMEVHG